MASENERLIKNSAIYSFFTLLQRGFSVILLPIYTIYLSKEEYGILSLMLSAIPFFALIFGLSVRGSTAYFYYEYKDNSSLLKRLLGTNFTLVVLISVICVALIMVSRNLWSSYIFDDIAYNPYILLALISTLFQPGYLFYQSLLKAKQEAHISAKLDSVYFVLVIILTVLFVIGLKMQTEGALLALAIANFSVFIYGLINISREITYCVDLQVVKKTLKYSLPILPHNLSAWAMDLSDRFILNKISTLEALASYDLGAQVGKLINIVTLGVNQAYSPWFIEQMKTKNDNKRMLAKSAEKLSLLYVLIAIALSWIAPELIKIIGNSSYEDSWTVVPFIAFTFSINGFYFCFSSVFFLNKTKYLPILTISGALVNILINLSLVPFYGILGAAIARLISRILFIILTLYVSQKLLYIPYRKSFIFGINILGFGIASLIYLIQPAIADYDTLAIIFIKILIIMLVAIPFIIANRYMLKNLLKK